MKTTEIILIGIAFLVLGFRIYQRYTKKKNENQGIKKDSLPGKEKEDDYEPYSNK